MHGKVFMNKGALSSVRIICTILGGHNFDCF